MIVAAMMVAPVAAQGLVPADFFNAPVDPSDPSEVEAGQLVFASRSNTITASGDVVLGRGGYVLKGQNLIYNRSTGDLVMTGNVIVQDPSGNIAAMPSLHVTGGLKTAFLESLTIVGYDGSRITADSVDYQAALLTRLVNATYAPCGECIDENGQRIGWSVRADTIIYNAVDGSVELEHPQLSLLGVPVAWLPYLWLPDLSDSALANVQRPSFDFSEEIGAKVEVPIAVYSSRTTDIILSPSLTSRQGFLLGAEWVQRTGMGAFTIKVSGLRQREPMAFAYFDSQREWRGALQSSGEFVPLEDWKVGWSYSAFTDLAYFEDYRLDPRKAAVNEVYTTHLTSDTFIDARVQQFNILGKTALTRQQQQGVALPNLRMEQRFQLPNEAGQIDVSARLLGVQREQDATLLYNGVPYVFGHAGSKMHGMLEASWTKQWVGLGGLVLTPFVGARVDAASYDGQSPLAGAPAANVLWSATPIAALDMRYPMVTSSPGVVHFIEPIAQLVYRGGAAALPGITNDDAQSVVLNDTNLFSFNRFTGIDRQETGLRANIGGRYTANFAAGGYLEFVAGQSFHLAGTNAFAATDVTNTGVGSGLATDASYVVVGAYGSFIEGVEAGGKLQLVASSMQIARAQFGASYSRDRWSASLTYRYAAAVPATGNIRDEHEIGLELSVPVAEYWSVNGSTYWDLNANSFLQVGAGVTYDDGYLVLGAAASHTGPTHYKPGDTRVLATFQLKAPAGFSAGYSGDVPVPDLGGQ